MSNGLTLEQAEAAIRREGLGRALDAFPRHDSFTWWDNYPTDRLPTHAQSQAIRPALVISKDVTGPRVAAVLYQKPKSPGQVFWNLCLIYQLTSGHHNVITDIPKEVTLCEPFETYHDQKNMLRSFVRYYFAEKGLIRYICPYDQKEFLRNMCQALRRLRNPSPRVERSRAGDDNEEAIYVDEEEDDGQLPKADNNRSASEVGSTIEVGRPKHQDYKTVLKYLNEQKATNLIANIPRYYEMDFENGNDLRIGTRTSTPGILCARYNPDGNGSSPVFSVYLHGKVLRDPNPPFLDVLSSKYTLDHPFRDVLDADDMSRLGNIGRLYTMATWYFIAKHADANILAHQQNFCNRFHDALKVAANKTRDAPSSSRDPSTAQTTQNRETRENHGRQVSLPQTEQQSDAADPSNPAGPSRNSGATSSLELQPATMRPRASLQQPRLPSPSLSSTDLSAIPPNTSDSSRKRKTPHDEWLAKDREVYNRHVKHLDDYRENEDLIEDLITRSKKLAKLVDQTHAELRAIRAKEPPFERRRYPSAWDLPEKVEEEEHEEEEE